MPDLLSGAIAGSLATIVLVLPLLLWRYEVRPRQLRDSRGRFARRPVSDRMNVDGRE